MQERLREADELEIRTQRGANRLQVQRLRQHPGRQAEVDRGKPDPLQRVPGAPLAPTSLRTTDAGTATPLNGARWLARQAIAS
ncbi:hypothetical protein AB0L41_34740 [Amycolatopsis mediterranei]|uniref:hypothetical protein n=1 Tax=Amycolatopsis mediterranei TaxID=33910 RepID=UPI00342EDE45